MKAAFFGCAGRAFAVASALVAACTVVAAQDLNLEARTDTFVPKVTDTTSPPEIERKLIREPAVFGTRTIKLKREQRLELLARKQGATVRTLLGQKAADIEEQLKAIPTTKKVPKLIKPATTRVEEKPKPRTVVHTFFGNAGYSYESNANTSRTNPIGDSIASGSAGFRSKIPIGPDADALTLLINSTSVRYAKLSSQDADILVGSAVYGHQLASTPGSSKTKSSDTAITDVLSLAVEGKSIHEAGYRYLKGNFLTSTATLSHNNMPLSDALCGDVGKEKFCTSATLSLATRYVLADVTSREYAATKVTGRAILLGEKGLTFTATGSVDFKYFTNFPGGREDIIYVASGELEWAISDSASLVGGLTFTYQTSTVPTAEWNGFAVGPQAKFSVKLN